MTLLLDYGKIDSDTSVMAPGLTTMFTAASLDFDGATRIFVEIDCPELVFYSFSRINLWLYDNGDAVNILGSAEARAGEGFQFYAATFLIPDAGTHVYSFVAEVLFDNVQFGQGRRWYMLTKSPATERAFVTRSSNFSGAGTWLSSGVISLDGSQRVRVEVFGPELLAEPGPRTVDLFLNGDLLGSFAKYSTSFVEMSMPVNGHRFLTPDAGSNEFTVESDADVIIAGGDAFPAWIRVTDA